MSRRKLTLMALGDIIPAVTNVKAHDIPLTSASIGRFGLIETPVLDERTGRLVAGHGRVEALQEAAIGGGDPPDGVTVDRKTGKWMVPVLTGWASADDNEAQAAAIALNRIGEKAGWEPLALAEQLEALAGVTDLTGLGFDPGDIDDLIASIQEGSLQFDADHQGYSTDAAFSGAQREPSFEERAQLYRDKVIRSLVLDYSLDEFELVARQAAEARTKLGLDSNAAVFARLLADLLA